MNRIHWTLSRFRDKTDRVCPGLHLGTGCDRQSRDLLAAGVRVKTYIWTTELFGPRSQRCQGVPGFERALDALHEGNTLVITTLDRLGRSKGEHAWSVRGPAGQGSESAGVEPRRRERRYVTAMGSMVFTVMAALAQIELEINANALTTPSQNAVRPARTSAGAASSSATVGRGHHCRSRPVHAACAAVGGTER